MAVAKQRLIKVIQDKNNVQHVMYMPTEQEICRFTLEKHSCTTANAQLVKRIENAFTSYFNELME